MINLIDEAQALFSIQLTSEQNVQLLEYQRLLIDWNTRINLTAIRGEEEILIKHFLDSMACTLVWKEKRIPETLIDVGTGAGFPGIVLKILFPEMKITLVESIHKKAEFCQHVIDALALSHVQVIIDRAESLAKQRSYNKKYDIAVARAVASLPTVLEYLLPFVQVGGTAVAMKGNHVDEELKSVRITGRIPYTLPHEVYPRNIITVQYY